MKMNNKGFTLIELLAVIVILAIIALISTPIIIGVIENARNKAAVNSAYGVIDAAKLAYTESIMSSTTSTSGNVTDLKISGDKPTAGTYSVNTETGAITIEGVQFGDYTCTGGNDNNAKVTCTKGNAGA